MKLESEKPCRLRQWGQSHPDMLRAWHSCATTSSCSTSLELQKGHAADAVLATKSGIETRSREVWFLFCVLLLTRQQVAVMRLGLCSEVLSVCGSFRLYFSGLRGRRSAITLEQQLPTVPKLNWWPLTQPEGFFSRETEAGELASILNHSLVVSPNVPITAWWHVPMEVLRRRSH